MGFLSMENEEAPGNLGLRDQALALQWVKNESANFCGNAEKITIFGSGSGGTAVLSQMMSPINAGKRLFQSVIAQSGSPVRNPVFEIGGRKKAALKLAKDVGCKNEKVLRN